MRPPQRRYGRDQIIHAGRWAWASSRGDDEPDLYFDGEAFWRGAKDGRVPATAATVPEEGWWHEKECRCALCRPAAMSER